MNLGFYHPQVVHFVVALLFVGVGARVLSLLPLPKVFGFLGPAAAALIILSAGASAAAVHTGTLAHGPIERIPGVREAVVEHEEWGKRARNALLAVALLEIVALAVHSRARLATGVRVAAALAGLGGAAVLFEAAEHGGTLVYAYAGGPGLRSNDTTDLRRLLVAGLYTNAAAARTAGRKDDAARLTEDLARQMPGDTGVAMLVLESRLKDRDDAAGALAALGAMRVAPANRRLFVQVATLKADALEALGRNDSARAVLEALVRDMPQVAERLRPRLERLRRP